MKCPVDGSTDMQHINKEGVQIDYCPSCNGVWLDRDELTKLVEVAGIDRRDQSIERMSASGDTSITRKTEGDAFESPRVGGMSGTVRQFDGADETVTATAKSDGIPAKKTPGDAFETPRVGSMSGIVRQLGGKVVKDISEVDTDTDTDELDTNLDRGSKYDRTQIPVSSSSPWDTGYVGSNRQPDGTDEKTETVEYGTKEDPAGDTAPLSSSTADGGRDHREGMFGDDTVIDRSNDVGFEGAAGTETGTNIPEEGATRGEEPGYTEGTGDSTKKKSFLDRLFGDN